MEKIEANYYNHLDIINELQDMIYEVHEEFYILKAFLKTKQIIINDKEFEEFKDSYRVMNKLINKD